MTALCGSGHGGLITARRAELEALVLAEVFGELGTSLEPVRSEAMRSKLNRLAQRGLLRKLAGGQFTTTL
ncbi:hypothetical protein ACFQ6S_07385 [Streptomyces sp. NPDC056479]|uniref:hypothetical protein n=1 Tax=Streptomyces sp. NPDC056479 TaxID=3345832 RepID=UPI003686D990